MMLRFLRLALTSGIVAGCLTPKPSSDTGRDRVHGAAQAPPPPADKLMLWDGDESTQGKSWADCSKKNAGCKAVVLPKDGTGLRGAGLSFHVEGPEWAGFGWNWHGFYPDNAGTDISRFKALSFWIRVDAKTRDKAPDLSGLKVTLSASGHGKKESADVGIGEYAEQLLDGQWHEIVIPLSEFFKDKGKDFDAKSAWEFRIGTYASSPKSFDIYIDEIGFDNRAPAAWVSAPEKREAKKLGGELLQVEAKVDLGSPGNAISPYIYGVSFGDQQMLKEMGVTTRRVGGNENSPYDWRTGFTSLGHDWYFQNRKAPETPHPEQNRWAIAFGEDKKYGIESYLTLPAMGWVAKDDKSFGFPRAAFPDQTEFAGDRPGAGSGMRVPKGAQRGMKSEIWLKAGESHNGKRVSVAEQTDLLKYSIEKSGFGRARNGGIKFVALDNEPMIWHTSHRDMITFQMGYEDYWNHMLPYATRLKQLDPDVQLAAPAEWGWTAYFYSAKDAYWVKTKNGDRWDRERLPEYALKHDKTPFLKWWLQKVGEYRRQNGKALIDICDVHIYSNMKTLEQPRDKQENVPEVMDFRLDSIRSLWDPDYRTKDTWIGDETGGKLAIIRLIKEWIAEGNPGMKFSIGEYEWSGWDGGYDISGAVAQVELFRVFAREGVDMAYYWANPKKNSPVFFAFKLVRNPDGKHSAIGDVLMPSTSSRQHDVEIFATRSSKDRGKLSFVLLNKRVKQGARVKLELSAALPEQQVEPYELSAEDPRAIGALPPRKIGGKTVEVELAPMSVLRFDARG